MSENQATLPVKADIGVGSNGIQITSLSELDRFASYLMRSNFKCGHKSKEDLLCAIQYGLEVGISPLQAVQNIAVINGRPSAYGDLPLALVQASGLCESIKEQINGEVAVCEVRRKGNPHPFTVTFSRTDAEKAGLWKKSGPWSSYPNRMLQMRARGFALRDAFPDVLKGLITQFEAEDMPPIVEPKQIQLGAFTETPITDYQVIPPPPPPPPRDVRGRPSTDDPDYMDIAVKAARAAVSHSESLDPSVAESPDSEVETPAQTSGGDLVEFLDEEEARAIIAGEIEALLATEKVTGVDAAAAYKASGITSEDGHPLDVGTAEQLTVARDMLLKI